MDKQALDALVGEQLGRAVRLGVLSELQRLPQLLAPDETVVLLAGGKKGLVVATDRRLLFVEAGLAHHRSADFPYERISTIELKRGFASTKLLVATAAASSEIDGVNPPKRAEEIAAYVRERQAAPAPAPTAAATPDVLAQLKQLAELRDGGVITEAEFEQKKQQLLARI